MKQHIAVLFCITLWATLCAQAFCAEEKPPEATVKGPGFHFTVALTRSTYLEGEPVLAKCSITNDLKKPQKLVETDINPRWTMCRLPSRDRVPIGFGSRGVWRNSYWLFKPDESRSVYFDLGQIIDGRTLRPGRYGVIAHYSVPKSIMADWTGGLTAPEIAFTVAAPQGREVDILNALNATRKGGTESEVRANAEILKRLSDERAGGRYSSLLDYRTATALKDIDKSAYIHALENYLARNPNVPFYSRIAGNELTYAYQRNGDFEAARTVLALRPDSWTKALLLRSIDRADKRALEQKK